MWRMYLCYVVLQPQWFKFWNPDEEQTVAQHFIFASDKQLSAIKESGVDVVTFFCHTI